jgi:hypothetical protein
MATKRKSAVEIQKEMVINLMLGGKDVYLTREGKGMLWGVPVEQIPVEGGGLRIIYKAAK